VLHPLEVGAERSTRVLDAVGAPGAEQFREGGHCVRGVHGPY
jgi:hypothetical protein